MSIENYNCCVQNNAIYGINKKDLFDVSFLLKLPEHVILQWISYLMLNNIETNEVSFSLFAQWINNISTKINDVNLFSNTHNINFETENGNKDKCKVLHLKNIVRYENL